MLAIFAAPVLCDPLRVATYAAPLSRNGPGLLLRDLQKGEDPQILAIRDVVQDFAPDVLLLTDFDYDMDGYALAAFAGLFADRYPYRFAGPPNSGLATGFDLDRNGRLGEARDAMGYGRFSGDGGMAVLSRFPIGQVTDYSTVLWRDVPQATLPAGYYPPEVLQILRLSSTAHWVVPIDAPDGPVHLLAFSATPPVFDGPEDRNGLRNRDELRFWQAVLDGRFGPPPADFVVLGNANLDPLAGDGLSQAMADFLADPRLQDPHPDQPTANWRDNGAGDLRVSYALPAAMWRVTDAGVVWPSVAPDGGLAAGPHHLVWVDITR